MLNSLMGFIIYREVLLSNDLAYTKENKWHFSAGSTNPNLPCGVSCPPFEAIKPKPNSIYELGIKVVLQYSTYKVRMYIVDLNTNIIYTIYEVEDPNFINPNDRIGCLMEARTIEESELSKIGNNNAFRIINTNWFIANLNTSTQWPHAYVRDEYARCIKLYSTSRCICHLEEGGKYKGYVITPRGIEIRVISPGDLYIGCKVGGSHYIDEAQLW